MIAAISAITIAKVECCTYVPYMCVGTTFCDVDFYGQNANLLEAEWRQVKYENFYKTLGKIEPLVEQLVSVEKEIQTLRGKYKKLRFWKISDRMRLSKNIQELQCKKLELQKRIDVEKENQFYTASELHAKSTLFLKQHGFMLTNYNKSDGKDIEIWESHK